MLGHVVARFFADSGAEVRTTGVRFTARNPGPFIDSIVEARPDWCINCIGMRPGQAASRDELFEANAILPEACVALLPSSVAFVQASTDGVFRPDQPNRSAEEPPDAEDDYGISKQRAETATLSANGIVIRCSVIGPEVGTSRSLLSWLLARESAIGYTNHFWNGVTSLEWAKQCWKCLNDPKPGAGRILQPGFLPAISKCELLSLIAREWNPSITVEPCEADVAVARTLLPNVPCPPISAQLQELHQWELRSPPLLTKESVETGDSRSK
jgi:dTDP-4-dehydrorhamnose reductase